jgi:DNA-binding transcriptional regulator YhcF (GntR family)
VQIELDPLSDVALYQQLRDQVVEGIARGRLRVGDALVPVRTLAAQFGINVATVAKGYELLRNEGLVRTNRTAGSIVARGARAFPSEPAPSLPGSGSWDPLAQKGWQRRLATVLAEAVAQGEPDTAIVAAVSDILQSFADSRAEGTSTMTREEEDGHAD